MWWRMSGDASEMRGRGCKRLSTLGGGACGVHTSSTGGRARARGGVVCSRLCISPFTFLLVCGGAEGVSASLLSAVVLVECIQAGREGGRARRGVVCFGPCICPFTFLPECVGDRGCKRFLLSAVTLVVCIQAGREGGRAVFFCLLRPLYFSIRIYHGVCGGASTALVVYVEAGREGGRAFLFSSVLPPLYLSVNISPGLCGGHGVQAPVYSRRRRLWHAYKRDGRADLRGNHLMCVRSCTFPLTFLPECVGGRGYKRRSTLGGSAYGAHTSGMGGQAREDVFGGVPCVFTCTLLATS